MIASVLSRMRRSRHPGLTLAVVCVAQFMVVLDVTIVNVALPDMRRGLDLSPNGLAWVLDSYALVFGGFMLLGGRAADLYGRKRTFLVGLVLFTLTSLLGGLAQNGPELIAARALQGLGGAVLSPSTLTLLSTTFTERRERDRAFGIWGAVGGIGGATGVLAGGMLTGLLSWRWIFLINVPVGVLVIGAAILLIRESDGLADDPRVDWLGALTGTCGLVALVYGVMRTDRDPWTSPTVLGFLALSLVLLGAFGYVERHHPRPLLPLRVFRSRELSGANAVMMCGAAATFGLFFFLSQYWQDVAGYGALRTGIAFLPMPLGIITGTQIASRLIGRFGARALLAVSSAISALGFLLLSFVDADSPYALHVALPGMLVTLGSGMSFVPLTMSATSGASSANAGLASGLINTSRQIGGSLGLSVLVTVAAAGRYGQPAGNRAAEAAGFADAFLVSGAFLLAAIVTALVVLPRHIRPVAVEAVPDPGLAPIA